MSESLYLPPSVTELHEESLISMPNAKLDLKSLEVIQTVALLGHQEHVNPYAILGLEEEKIKGYTDEEAHKYITQRRNKLLLFSHTDKTNHHGAEEITKMINKAVEFLLVPHNREKWAQGQLQLSGNPDLKQYAEIEQVLQPDGTWRQESNFAPNANGDEYEDLEFENESIEALSPPQIPEEVSRILENATNLIITYIRKGQSDEKTKLITDIKSLNEDIKTLNAIQKIDLKSYLIDILILDAVRSHLVMGRTLKRRNLFKEADAMRQNAINLLALSSNEKEHQWPKSWVKALEKGFPPNSVEEVHKSRKMLDCQGDFPMGDTTHDQPINPKGLAESAEITNITGQLSILDLDPPGKRFIQPGYTRASERILGVHEWRMGKTFVVQIPIDENSSKEERNNPYRAITGTELGHEARDEYYKAGRVLRILEQASIPQGWRFHSVVGTASRSGYMSGQAAYVVIGLVSNNLSSIGIMTWTKFKRLRGDAKARNEIRAFHYNNNLPGPYEEYDLPFGVSKNIMGRYLLDRYGFRKNQQCPEMVNAPSSYFQQGIPERTDWAPHMENIGCSGNNPFPPVMNRYNSPRRLLPYRDRYEKNESDLDSQL